MEPLDLLILFIGAITTGFFSSQLSKALDFGMDYGHWIDWFRMNKAYKAAMKVDKIAFFVIERDKILEYESFDDRLNMMDQLYWKIARDYKPLTMWLCRVCLSHRINFLVSLYMMVLLFMYYGFNPFILAFYLVSFSVNQLIITS